MDNIFQIGNFVFRLCCPKEIVPPPNFMLFETEGREPEYTYEIRVSPAFPHLDGELIAKRPDLLVFQSPFGESRLIGVKGIPGYYACYREISDINAEIMLSPDRLKGLHIDPVFTSLLALERRMIQKSNMILHCAYIQYKNEAILLSAPSETGKTTQANLWEQYRGSKTVNGDRALLGKVDGRWTAQGWPVCGTSEVCHNESIPIRAIVMLNRGKDNQVERLKPMQAFSLLYGQITINRWNVEDNKHAIDMIESLIADIPIFNLSCTISEASVVCLENVLYPFIQDLGI